MSYTQKYLKYKSKYLELKYKMRGGASQSKVMPKDVNVHRGPIKYQVTKSDGSVFYYIIDEKGTPRDPDTHERINIYTGNKLSEFKSYNPEDKSKIVFDADN